jgi:CRP-like cAMP-binding protein
MTQINTRMKAPAFAPVESNSLEQFGPLYLERKIPSGIILHEQGSFPSKLILIKSGVAKMVYTGLDGSEIMLGLRSAGWVAGAAHILTDTVCTSTVVSITPCEIAEFEPEDFAAKLKTGGPLAYRVMCMLAQELVTTRELIKQVMSSSAEQRLKTYLEENRSDKSKWNTVDTASMLKQSEIAQLLGISPEHLSRLTHKRSPAKA